VLKSEVINQLSEKIDFLTKNGYSYYAISKFIGCARTTVARLHKKELKDVGGDVIVGLCLYFDMEFPCIQHRKDFLKRVDIAQRKKYLA